MSDGTSRDRGIVNIFHQNLSADTSLHLGSRIPPPSSSPCLPGCLLPHRPLGLLFSPLFLGHCTWAEGSSLVPSVVLPDPSLLHQESPSFESQTVRPRLGCLPSLPQDVTPGSLSPSPTAPAIVLGDFTIRAAGLPVPGSGPALLPLASHPLPGPYTFS